MIEVTLKIEVEKRTNGAAPKISEAYDKVEIAAREMGVIKKSITHTVNEVTLIGAYELTRKTVGLPDDSIVDNLIGATS